MTKGSNLYDVLMDKTGDFHYRFMDLAIPGQKLKTVQKLPSLLPQTFLLALTPLIQSKSFPALPQIFLLALMPFIQFLEPLQMRFHFIFFTATFLLL